MSFWGNEDECGEQPRHQKAESLKDYDTRNLDRAVDHLERIQELAGSSFGQAQIYTDLVKVREMGEQVIDDKVEDKEIHEAFWNLLDEVSMDALQMHESAKNLSKLLSDLEGLRPWEDED